MRTLSENSDEVPRRIMSKCVDELINEEEIAVCSSNDAYRQFISRIKKVKKPYFLQISQPESLKQINMNN
ncbi:unnamed protein product [Brachionus calyciflorus]|uniref:Uncharacterized protein n=1 Tax=Brachionus calyciflorus TaxID=104777 RepID=A0A813NTS6_9BILA|nr:unnamed protein product [Brachionus calyciflorus]